MKAGLVVQWSSQAPSGPASSRGLSGLVHGPFNESATARPIRLVSVFPLELPMKNRQYLLSTFVISGLWQVVASQKPGPRGFRIVSTYVNGDSGLSATACAISDPLIHPPIFRFASHRE